MAVNERRVIPFKGVRYNVDVVDDMNKVVCPPYDIISPEDRVYYHQLSPYNFVRLVLGEEFDSDTDQDNRFTRAGEYLAKWLDEGVVQEEPTPAMYLYRQDFERGGAELSVTGLTCAVRIHEYADQVILPHENTLSKPKSQLKDLIRSVRANLDSVYGLYEDPDAVVQQILDRIAEDEPACDVIDKDAVRHRVWAISDSVDLQNIEAFFQDKQIAIADGHHRYETALAYSKDVREEKGVGSDVELASDYVLMTIANVYQPDLTVLPTHRVLSNLPPEKLLNLSKGLAQTLEAKKSSRRHLLSDMKKHKAIGVYVNELAFVINKKDATETGIEGCAASQELEVNILHKLVLENLLGLTAEDLRNQTYLTYTRDSEEALSLVDSGSAQIALLLNPVGVKSVMDISSAGDKMPQKSTYFYPKLLSGLVLRLLG